MRVFHRRLFFDKETDGKFRWRADVEGVEFKLYITQGRVPRPVPKIIEVSIFDDKSLYTAVLTKLGRKSVSELSDADKSILNGIGLDEVQIRNAGGEAILGAAFKPVCAEHTQTVRYTAPRHFEELEFGDPYVPKSVLRFPYPERLLFLVRWIEQMEAEPARTLTIAERRRQLGL
jgi:hypothetical protein